MSMLQGQRHLWAEERAEASFDFTDRDCICEGEACDRWREIDTNGQV
jgi:hypothetical protein